MFDFFPKIVKNKKIFIFGFLFLVFLYIVAPQMVYASWNPWNPEFYLTEDGTELNATGKFVNDAVDALEEGGKLFFLAFVMGASTIILLFANALSSLASGLFLWILSIQESISFTHITGPNANPAVAAGWPMLRDLANMVVVLGFVVIGIATILRFKEYEAKKLLPKLIIAALLINFSLLICGIFIDGSNLAIKSFGDGAGSSMATSWGRAVFGNIETVWSNFDTKQMGKSVGLAVGITFGEIIRFIVYMLFFFLFLFRYFALWILVILSPLAFVLYVFPFTKKFFDMWWSNFLAWCIIGIPGMFFVWLSDTISSDMLKSSASAPSTPGGTGSFMVFLIPGFFMIIGLLFSIQTSAMGAGAAIGAAKWSGGKLMGAGAGGALRAGRLADRATGGKFSEWSDKSKQKIARISETLGGKTGSAAQTQQARNTDAEKTVDALLSAPAGSKDRLRGEQLVKTGRGALGAAAVKKANEMGELSDLLGNDMNKIDQRSTFAGQFGHAKKQFEDKNPFLAGMDPQKIEKELVAMGLPNTAPGRARAKSSLIRKSVEKNWNNMSTSERANIDISDWHADDQREFIFGSNGSSFIDAQRSLSTDPLTPGGALREKNTDVLLGAYDPDLYGPGIGGRVGGIFGNNPNTLNNAHEGDAELNRRASRGDTTGERELKNRRSKAHSLV